MSAVAKAKPGRSAGCSTWTTDYLKQHGADSPRLDAEVLLAAAAGCQRIQLYTRFDEPAAGRPADQFSRIGAAAGRRDAGGLSGRPARILFAAVSRHARRVDSAARDRIAGGGPARSHPRPRRGRRSAWPTSAPARASSPSARPNMCRRPGSRRSTSVPQALAVARGSADDLKVGRADRVDRKRSVCRPAGRAAVRFHRLESPLRQRKRIRRAWLAT